MRLLIDMNLSPRWVDLFASAGIGAAHWTTLGAATAPDAAIMKYACENDYVVLTHDLDFSAILAATGGGKPSVIQIRAEDISLGAIGTQVIAAIRQTVSELEAGALITIEPTRMRMRLLPLLSRP
nr:DUF5615 family PIN-like protein [uncultured Rhodopila sp.]